ncbi:MAG TPA: thioredoxin family protein [Cyclobacteriaceae bacterium]|nr:thioredoxin family protein [Cyclobacteriaceae bacterium]
MARTPSTMVELGTDAPDFRLEDVVSGQTKSLSDVKGKRGTLVMFICNHCPFVKHINEELVKLGNEFPSKGISLVAINSNDVENYPEDRPDLMKEIALTHGYRFPYLYDETQEVARAYDAACTPDFFLFDADLKLVYRGQLDDSRPGNDIPVTGRDLRTAMNALVNGKRISADQRPSLGCNIKWKT